jgi:preprotein translocase subunit SecA
MLKLFSRLMDSNEREVRKLEPFVERANELEPEFTALTDDALRAKTAEFRARLRDRLGDLLTPIEEREGELESVLTGDEAGRAREERKEQAKRELVEINDALDELLPEALSAVR